MACGVTSSHLAPRELVDSLLAPATMQLRAGTVSVTVHSGLHVAVSLRSLCRLIMAQAGRAAIENKTLTLLTLASKIPSDTFPALKGTATRVISIIEASEVWLGNFRLLVELCTDISCRNHAEVYIQSARLGQLRLLHSRRYSECNSKRW